MSSEHWWLENKSRLTPKGNENIGTDEAIMDSKPLH